MAAVAFPNQIPVQAVNLPNILKWSNNEFYLTKMMGALQHDITKWVVNYDALTAKTECQKCGVTFTVEHEIRPLSSGEMSNNWVIREGDKHLLVCYLNEDDAENDIAIVEESDEHFSKCIVPIVGANCNQEAFNRLYEKLPDLAARYFRHCFGHSIEFRHTGDYVITNGRVFRGVKSMTVVGACTHCDQEFAIQAANDLAIMQVFERISVFIELVKNAHSFEKWFERALERQRCSTSITMMNPMYAQHGCTRFNVLR